jgi:hypothetical protein
VTGTVEVDVKTTPAVVATVLLTVLVDVAFTVSVTFTLCRSVDVVSPLTKIVLRAVEVIVV